MTDTVRTLLRQQLDVAWQLTSYHLDTLTTAECLWRPAPVGLHVTRGDDGRWHADWPTHEGYDLGPASIAWLTWHLGFWWSMTLDHAFGDGTLAREQVSWPGDADGVRAWVRGLHARWVAEVEALSDAALAEDARTRWPITGRPFAEVVAWVNLELMKNAAEIGYARFCHAVAPAAGPAGRGA